MTILQIQALLVYHGFNPGAPDGVMGEKTKTATRAFQERVGLAADGAPGPVTQKALLEYINTPMPEKPTESGQDTPTAPEGGNAGTFWGDIPDFKRREFACPCPRCGGFPAEPAENLVRAAQALRGRVGKPVHISSGVRCVPHNAKVGGKANSRHLIGHAMDFRVDGMTAAQVLPLAQATPGIVYAYAIDECYVHMDIGK